MNDYLQIRELYHHGIKGQKWGVRRYQNEDGTLTENGQLRYNEYLHQKKRDAIKNSIAESSNERREKLDEIDANFKAAKKRIKSGETVYAKMSNKALVDILSDDVQRKTVADRVFSAVQTVNAVSWPLALALIHL